jgi:hypothetical protein
LGAERTPGLAVHMYVSGNGMRVRWIAGNARVILG